MKSVLSVLVRGEDNDELPRPDVGGREAPLGEVARIVRERPIEQVHRVRARVVDLDPVLMGALFVHEARGVLRHEFRDDNLTGCPKGGEKTQGEDESEMAHHCSAKSRPGISPDVTQPTRDDSTVRPCLNES